MDLSKSNLIYSVSAILDIDDEENGNIQIKWRRLEKWNGTDFIELTEEELKTVVTSDYTIVSRYTDSSMSFEGSFTLREVINHVLEFEKIDRPKTDWFGGIDAHHIFFEGFSKIKDKDNTYSICWGS